MQARTFLLRADGISYFIGEGARLSISLIAADRTHLVQENNAEITRLSLLEHPQTESAAVSEVDDRPECCVLSGVTGTVERGTSGELSDDDGSEVSSVRSTHGRSVLAGIASS